MIAWGPLLVPWEGRLAPSAFRATGEKWLVKNACVAQF